MTTGDSRIPHFSSIEEEAAFWDTHSTEDFADELESAEDVCFVRPGHAFDMQRLLTMPGTTQEELAQITAAILRWQRQEKKR